MAETGQFLEYSIARLSSGETTEWEQLKPQMSGCGPEFPHSHPGCNASIYLLEMLGQYTLINRKKLYRLNMFI
jgi:hypothetical protein